MGKKDGDDEEDRGRTELEDNGMALDGKLTGREEDEHAGDVITSIAEEKTLKDREEEGAGLTGTRGGGGGDIATGEGNRDDLEEGGKGRAGRGREKGEGRRSGK